MNTPTLTGAYTCTHHNDRERAACPVCLVIALTSERDQLRAELATAKERLRSEAMDDYAAIKDLQRELATEREKAERFRLVTLRQDCELATERGKLDWVFQNCKVEANDYTTGNRDVYYVHDREDLGAAMKEDAK